jgi:hypothetical protein
MKFVRRSEWQACDPKNPLEEFGDMPAQYIIMGHCNSTSDSTDIADGCANMRRMQQFHMYEKGWLSAVRGLNETHY